MNLEVLKVEKTWTPEGTNIVTYVQSKPPIQAFCSRGYHPVQGKLMIKISKRVDQTKSGLYLDTSYPTGTEYNYHEECAKVATAIIKSEEGRYMKRHNQTEKLIKTIRRELARVPRETNSPTLGKDRYNQIHAEVLESSARDIQKGDTVYFPYLTIPNLQSDKCIFSDEEDFGFIDASKCYFIIRKANRDFFTDEHGQQWCDNDGCGLVTCSGQPYKEEIIMLNDYYLIDPVEIKLSGILNGLNTFDEQKGKVAFAPENSKLKKGDMIVMDKGSDTPLEYSLIQTLPKVYYCLKGEEILGTING